VIQQTVPPSDPIERIATQLKFASEHNRDMIAVSTADLAHILFSAKLMPLPEQTDQKS
jgi:hypothetical protein